MNSLVEAQRANGTSNFSRSTAKHDCEHASGLQDSFSTADHYDTTQTARFFSFNRAGYVGVFDSVSEQRSQKREEGWSRRSRPQDGQALGSSRQMCDATHASGQNVKKIKQSSSSNLCVSDAVSSGSVQPASHHAPPATGSDSKRKQRAMDTSSAGRSTSSASTTKRVKHRACTYCASKKLACSAGRPCERCVRRGLGDECRNQMRKREIDAMLADGRTAKTTTLQLAASSPAAQPRGIPIAPRLQPTFVPHAAFTWCAPVPPHTQNLVGQYSTIGPIGPINNRGNTSAFHQHSSDNLADLTQHPSIAGAAGQLDWSLRVPHLPVEHSPDGMARRDYFPNVAHSHTLAVSSARDSVGSSTPPFSAPSAKPSAPPSDTMLDDAVGEPLRSGLVSISTGPDYFYSHHQQYYHHLQFYQHQHQHQLQNGHRYGHQEQLRQHPSDGSQYSRADIVRGNQYAAHQGPGFSAQGLFGAQRPRQPTVPHHVTANPGGGHRQPFSRWQHGAASCGPLVMQGDQQHLGNQMVHFPIASAGYDVDGMGIAGVTSGSTEDRNVNRAETHFAKRKRTPSAAFASGTEIPSSNTWAKLQLQTELECAPYAPKWVDTRPGESQLIEPGWAPRTKTPSRTPNSGLIQKSQKESPSRMQAHEPKQQWSMRRFSAGSDSLTLKSPTFAAYGPLASPSLSVPGEGPAEENPRLDLLDPADSPLGELCWDEAQV